MRSLARGGGAPDMMREARRHPGRRPGIAMPWVAALLLTSATPLPSAIGAPRDRTGDSLARDVERIVNRPVFAAAFWGIEVRSLRSGRVLYAMNAEKNLKPASTLKVVTTAAALDAFGPDERLRTTVETAGRLDGLGRILGDVYLVGRGDPDLSGRFAGGRITAAFEELAEALRAGGVRRIEGRLVGHEGLFRGDRRGEDWSWGDLVWRYGAEVSALSFNDNIVTLQVSPGERVGDPVLVEASPPSSYYRILSTAVTTTAASPNELTLVREAGGNVIRLSGGYPLGQAPNELGVALEDPARYAATVFREVLESRGIRVAGPVDTSRDPLPGGLRVLAIHASPSLAEIVKGVNKTSQNLHAEMLLRLLGARVKGEGSAEGGHAAVDEFLARLGVHAATWDMRDGSGLSRSDLVTPRGLVELLAAMDRHRYAPAFRDSLPVAGADGTLAHRLGSAPVEGRVQAKTGTIRHVNALAGYLTTRSGDRLAFAIVVNHHTEGGSAAVGAIDEIVRALAAR